MGYTGSNNGQAINFSIKIAGKYFNFNNGVNLTIERHMGDCMNKFSMSVIDGSDDTTKNIDMLFNNGGKTIELKYGYGSNLVSMTGMLIDYKHTFVGDVYRLDMSGYVSLATNKQVYDQNVNKYYIDWGPCIPKRINEGMQWDAFYNAVQQPEFWITKAMRAKNTDDESYKFYSGMMRFSNYYDKWSPTLLMSLEKEKEWNKKIEELISLKNELLSSKKEGASWWLHNAGWILTGGDIFHIMESSDAYNAEADKLAAELTEYAKIWGDFISQYSSANNIVGLKLQGPKGSCWVPYPDLFINFDGTCPTNLNAVTDMCDTWAFGLQTETKLDDKGVVEKFYISNDWAQMVKDKWKLRVLTIKDKKYVWVGDVPQNINDVKNENKDLSAEENEKQTEQKKRWLTAAYNAAAPIRDAGIRVSDIVKNLCDMEGWKYDETTIVDTSYTNAADDALRMNGEGAFEYIVEKLCPIAVDTGGSRTNYKAWFDSKDYFHFEPLAISKPHDYIDIKFGYNIKDSPVLAFQITTNGITISAFRNDSISGVDSASGMGTQVSSSARDFKSALVLAYEKNPNDSKLLFNEALYNTLGFNSSKSSYDYYKSEVMVNGEIKDNCINIQSQNKHISSTTSSSDASAILANDMAHFEEKLIQAEMTIVGMPEVQPGKWVRLVNRVKGGRRHYSSGGVEGYWIQSVVDTISSDGYTQKCKMIRYAKDSYYFQDNPSYEELMRGTGDAYHVITKEEAEKRGQSSGSGSSGSSSGGICVGATVYIKSDASKFTTGETIASLAKNRPSQVKSVSGDRALITYNGVVIGWVYLSDLTLTSGGSSVPSGGSLPISGNTLEDKTWNFLRNAGYSTIAVAAAMGNIMAESSFKPTAIEASGGGGFGLCQWTGGRRVTLINYAKSKGKDVNDAELQLEFLLAELTGNGAPLQLLARGLIYSGSKWYPNDWKNSPDLGIATTAFMACFEAPDQRPNYNHLDRRKSWARSYYAKYAT